MAEIFVVEDDPVLAKSLVFYIAAEDHVPHWAPGLQVAETKFQQLRSQIDLIVLDLNLSDGSGLSFCRKIRTAGFNRPVLILTAMNSESWVLEGFDAGANDYIKKPFSMRELLARIRIHIHGAQPMSGIRQFAGLRVDFSRGQISYKEIEIPISRTKLDILECLILNSSRIISREAMLQHLNKGTDVFDRTIDAHISQLRRILRQHNIHHVQITSIYGIGYKIETVAKSPTAL